MRSANDINLSLLSETHLDQWWWPIMSFAWLDQNLRDISPWSYELCTLSNVEKLLIIVAKISIGEVRAGSNYASAFKLKILFGGVSYLNKWYWDNCILNKPCYLSTAQKVSVFGVVVVRIFSYSVLMRENTDQSNSGYGHFSRSERNSVVKV